MTSNHNHFTSPKIKWFYAVDVANSKPSYYNYTKTQEPQKFIPFSDYDSLTIENTYQKTPTSKVLVNEDKLFEADLASMEISPVYWEGPTYEIRRGLWYKDGVPLPTETGIEIEEGYEFVKPYLFNQVATIPPDVNEVTTENLASKNEEEEEETKPDEKERVDMYTLKSGQTILYFNDKDAVIIPSTYKTKFQLNVVRTLGSNSLLGVYRIRRGYDDHNKKANEKKQTEVDEQKQDEQETTTRDQLENEVKEENLEQDFDLDTSKEESNREIDHLVFCVHGIGQLMGSKNEAYTFSHSVNLLRKVMKKMFNDRKEYQDLVENNDDPLNNRIQVLPITWRHKISFNPKRTGNDGNEDRLPSLAQINVDGITFIREILGDVGCDILLYYEKEYLLQMLTAVTSELNRVYSLYKKINPNFSGKVHILGHSLGSALTFDILSGQSGTIKNGTVNLENQLVFDVENLFLLGSPVGIFKLIERKNIYARNMANPAQEPGTFVSPKCQNLYNIFHPCDPIAYRVEPLVNPKFGDFKAVNIPFAVKGGISSHLEKVAQIGDIISTKLWIGSRNMQKKDSSEDDNDDDGAKIFKKREIHGEQLKQLTSLNASGRIDYALPMGMFDISILSALASHLGYFEDENTVGFIIRQLLTKRDKPLEKTVASLY